MAVLRWDPWRDLAALEQRLDEAFRRGGRGGQRSESRSWAPAIDVHQDGDTLVVRTELAGNPPDQVEITVDDDVLTIAGERDDDRSVDEGNWVRRERYSGRFQRSINLPRGVDPKSIKATASHGVIEIRIPQPSLAEPHRVALDTSDEPREVAVQQPNADDAAKREVTETTTTDEPTPQEDPETESLPGKKPPTARKTTSGAAKSSSTSCKRARSSNN